MRIGIRTKFLLLIAILLTLIFGTITYVQINGRTKVLRQNLLDESKAFASLATQPIGNTFAIYKDSGTLKISQQIDQFKELNINISKIYIVDVSGNIVFSQNGLPKTILNSEEASTFKPIYKSNASGTLETIIFPYFEGSGSRRYTVVYSVSDDEIEKSVKQEAMQLLYFGIISMLTTMGLVYVLINKFIIKRVRKVSEQAVIISEGNLEQDINIQGNDEIASLGESVNKMAESLKTSIAKLKEVDKVKSEFMMITSHNLRTPLTIISGYLDNMELVAGNPEKLKSALGRIGSSVKRLEVFAEDVLTISRFELGDGEIKKEKIQAEKFLKQISTDFASNAEDKTIDFSSTINDGNTELSINIPYIRNAIWNILDNSAKFTKTGGKISFLTGKVNNNYEIEISDTGIGISKDEIPKLFTKFHRGTSTLTYDFEGTGIGLYASKVMVEKHGGTISVESEEGKGSTFTIKLPIS